MNAISHADAFEMWRLLAGGVTVRQTAIVLGLSKPTVLRHVFLFGEAARDAYCGNIEEGCDPDLDMAQRQAWLDSTRPITLSGFRFRPVSAGAEADARRFYVAKAKQAKDAGMLARNIAIRVAHAALLDCDGAPPFAVRAGLIPAPWHPDLIVVMALDPGMGYIEMAREAAPEWA